MISLLAGPDWLTGVIESNAVFSVGTVLTSHDMHPRSMVALSFHLVLSSGHDFNLSQTLASNTNAIKLPSVLAN